MRLPDARAIAGAGVFGLSLIVLGMLYTKPELGDSDLFKSVAQAIIMQGLIGLAMAYYFTSQHRPQASGKPDDPVHVQEENPDV